jgi:c-di-GMP-binding flagellar brake protein YcgR
MWEGVLFMLPGIGQVLRVKERQDASEYLYSRLIETEPDHLIIDVPLKSDGTALKSGEFSAIWIEYHARDGAICRFQTEYIESVRVPGLAWKIRRPRPNSIYKEQRREFVRVPADIEVTLYYSEGGNKQESVFTTDISGGGMAVLVPRHVVLSVGSDVRAQFVLPSDKSVVDVKCFVVRIGDRNERGYALVSLQFIKIDEATRRRIIQYTFARQRMIGRSESTHSSF